MVGILNAVVIALGLLFTIGSNGAASAADSSCPEANLEEAKKVDAAFTDFAVSFYKNVSAGAADKNVVLSPLSVALAVALLESGASGETRKEIQNVLLAKAAAADGEVLASYRALQKQVQIDQPKSRLTVANGVFISKSASLKSEYVKIVKECFESESESLDFTGEKLEESRQRINSWVSDKTVKKIPELFKPGSLTPNVALVLANAIYFKSSWKNSFNAGATQPGKFYRSGAGAGQNEQTVSFMKDRADYGYAKSGDAEILDLPYDNKDFSMYIVLPTARDGLPALERGLTGPALKSLLASVRGASVKVEIPKFIVRTSVDLNQILAAMGLAKMFSQGAEFERMSEVALKVSRGVHEAYINVNENGTEAAAATGFAMVPRMGRPPVEPKVFVADHPFLYAIVHKPTGAVIFLGKVNYVEEKEV